jgi:hypothetical protein
MQLADRSASNRVLPWTRSTPPPVAAGRAPSTVPMQRAQRPAQRMNGAAMH